jgi:uncharacterized sulfatase
VTCGGSPGTRGYPARRCAGRAESREVPDHVPDFDTSRFREGTLTSLRSREYRYDRADDGSDLSRLPDETTPVADDDTGVRGRMDAAVEAFLGAHSRQRDSEGAATFTPEMEAQLEDLGYL